jgi:iron complex outermembrane receptor protein
MTTTTTGGTTLRRRHVRTLVLSALFVIAAGGLSAVSAQQQPRLDLIEMSLEELLSLEITSAGKKEQLIGDTAAAIYVITADDIRRSQATTIMELLRQVPGMHVARETTGKWSISIRGFTQENANKLLVLMDGRSLYTPVYTGVEWDDQDTLLEDIDRIEIIRGPGASLWGANAVNGVVNIITKDARDTQGAAVTYQTGTLENGTVAARYGGSIGDTAHYRVFSKYFDRPNMPDAEGVTPAGGWDAIRQGGRLDWRPSARDHVTMTGEWLLSRVNDIDEEMTPETFPFETTVIERDRTRSSFLLGRWSRAKSSGSNFAVQFFYDRSRQFEQSNNDRGELVETTDLEFQYRLAALTHHDVVWGGGFRQVRDRVTPALDSWFSPNRFAAYTYNAFFQDEIAWRQKTVRFTAGSKLEWNSFSGVETQPTARLLWAPTTTHSVWTAASRAVRVPSRYELDQYSIEEVEEEDDEIAYELVVPPLGFRPESLKSYEAGYRFVPTRRFSVDVTSFYNVYDHLQTLASYEPEQTALPIAGVMTPLVRTNAGFGNVYGTELLAFWTITEALQVSGSYSRLQMRMDDTGFPHNDDGERMEDQYAANLFFLRAYTDLPYRVELNGELRYVGRLEGQEVPGYVDGNVHVSRPIRNGLRWKLSLDNLLHRRHGEWDEGELTLPRGIRAGLEWRF